MQLNDPSTTSGGPLARSPPHSPQPSPPSRTNGTSSSVLSNSKQQVGGTQSKACAHQAKAKSLCAKQQQVELSACQAPGSCTRTCMRRYGILLLLRNCSTAHASAEQYSAPCQRRYCSHASLSTCRDGYRTCFLTQHHALLHMRASRREPPAAAERRTVPCLAVRTRGCVRTCTTQRPVCLPSTEFRSPVTFSRKKTVSCC